MDTMADDVEAAAEYLADFSYDAVQCTAMLGYLQVTYPWPQWMDMLMEFSDEEIHQLSVRSAVSAGAAASSQPRVAAPSPSAEEAVPPKAGWVWKKGGSKHNAEMPKHGPGAGLRKRATAKKTSWKKRWLQVNGQGHVIYLKDPKDLLKGVEKGRVDLREYQVRGDLGNKEGFSSKEHGFSLVSPEREIFFGALSDRDKQEWLAYLLTVQEMVTGANCKTMVGARTPQLPAFEMPDVKLQLPPQGRSSSPDRSPSASPSMGMRRDKVGWLYKKGGMSHVVMDADELRRIFLNITGSSTGRLDRDQVGTLSSECGMPMTDGELDNALVGMNTFENGTGGGTVC